MKQILPWLTSCSFYCSSGLAPDDFVLLDIFTGWGPVHNDRRTENGQIFSSCSATAASEFGRQGANTGRRPSSHPGWLQCRRRALENHCTQESRFKVATLLDRDVNKTVAYETETFGFWSETRPMQFHETETSDFCHCCTNCEELIDTKSVHYDICDNYFHQDCSGMSSDIFEILLQIVNETGRVCKSCRDRLSPLQTALARVTEELSDIRLLLNQFSIDHNNIKKSVTTLENAWSVSTTNATAKITATVDDQYPISNNSNHRQTRSSPDISLEVYRALSDKARRKQNVIVTGLPEAIEDDLSDEMKFIHLCEEHLSIKPALK